MLTNFIWCIVFVKVSIEICLIIDTWMFGVGASTCRLIAFRVRKSYNRSLQENTYLYVIIFFLQNKCYKHIWVTYLPHLSLWHKDHLHWKQNMSDHQCPSACLIKRMHTIISFLSCMINSNSQITFNTFQTFIYMSFYLRIKFWFWLYFLHNWSMTSINLHSLNKLDQCLSQYVLPGSHFYIYKTQKVSIPLLNKIKIINQDKNHSVQCTFLPISSSLS